MPRNPLLMETVQRRWGLNDWIDEFQSTIDWILKETKQMSWYCRWQPEIRLILTSWSEGSLSTIIYWVLAPCQVAFLAGNSEPSTVCHVKLQGCFPGLVWGSFYGISVWFYQIRMLTHHSWTKVSGWLRLWRIPSFGIYGPSLEKQRNRRRSRPPWNTWKR